MDEYRSPSKGLQVICRMHPNLSRQRVLDSAQDIAELGLLGVENPFKILKRTTSRLSDGSLVLGYILSESHLVVIVNPDGTVHYDLYTCRGPEDGKETFDYIKNNLKAEVSNSVRMHVIPDEKELTHDNFAKSNGLFVPKPYLSSTFLGVDHSSLPKGKDEEERNADLTRKLRPSFGPSVESSVVDYNEFFGVKSDIPSVTFLYVMPDGSYVWGHSYLGEFKSACFGTYRRDGRSTEHDLRELQKVFSQ